MRLESNKNILFAAKLALFSTTTHENVFIGLFNPESKDSKLLLVPISSKRIDLQIDSINEEMTTPPIPTYIPGFEAPSKPGTNQLKRLEKIYQGEIP